MASSKQLTKVNTKKVTPSEMARKIKMDKIVELWQQTFGHITNICRAVGISRLTFYKWLEKYPEFNQRIAEAEGELNDEMRDVLIKKAGEGDNACLIFYLKNRHPDFAERPQLVQQFNVDGKEMRVNFIKKNGD